LQIIKKIGMGRVLSIDYGKKRVGIAVTDPFKIIATRLTTVSANEIWGFLSDYFAREEVDLVLVGYPRQLNNEPSEAIRYINPFLKKFSQIYKDIPVKLMDERFTSRMAFQTMIDAGLKKKDRQNKETIDGVSATIILQSYLEEQKFLK
jgi:putative holliday junction resolvase